ncbi:MAG: hypothetical protein RIE08_13655 [Acidimicrobiales bacterium]
MTSPQPSKPTGWFSGRTRLVTIVSVFAVVLAGATAVSANIGILDNASDSPVGNVSAAGDLTTPSAQVVDVYLPDTSAAEPSTSTSVADADGVQEFAVDTAGTVAVATTDAGVRLEWVAPAPGWSWNLAQSDPSTLTVTMTDGSRALDFTAVSNADGTITASVSERAGAPVAATTPYDDDHDDEYDDEHDDEYDDYEDEYEHREYEGREDDD